jgi:chromosome partitioning protein
MKVLTVIQTKGGSGKTTTAQVIASAAVERGLRVHMLDGDVNAQLVRWRGRFEQAEWDIAEKPEWPQNLTVSKPPVVVEELYALLEELEGQGIDLVIVDTRPGTHTDTEDLCLAADLVIIPARPLYSEWELTEESFLWMGRLADTIDKADRFPEVRTLVMDAPPKVVDAASREGGVAELPRRDQEVLQRLIALPHLDTIVPTSKILGQIAFHGPLGAAKRANEVSRGGRLIADAIGRQLDVALSLLDEIVELTS